MFVKKNFDTDFYGSVSIHDARIHSIDLSGIACTDGDESAKIYADIFGRQGDC